MPASRIIAHDRLAISPDLRPAPPPSDGHFYQKWAPLHDPRDTRAGTKGFVKVTLSARARGDLPTSADTPGPETQFGH